MAVERPALELLRGIGVVVRRGVVARAPEGGPRRDDALLERRHRGDRLERRAHRLGLLGGAVQQRVVRRLLGELLVGLRLHAADPHVGVEGRVAGHAEHVAVLDVQHDRRGAVGVVLLVGVGEADAGAQGLFGRRLDLAVDGRDQRVAGVGHATADRGGLLWPAEGVDLDARDAVAPAQPLVVGELQAVVADDVARRVALEVLQLELLGRDLAEVAEHLRRHVALRVRAQRLVLDLDPRELQGALLEVGHHLAADVVLEHDQVEAGDLPLGHLLPGQEAAPRAVRVLLQRARIQVVLDALAQLPRLHVEDGDERRKLLVERLLGHVHQADADGLAGAVADDRLALAVHDVAARRDDLDRAETVVVGLRDELLAAQDLQEPQAEEDDAEQHHGDADDDGDAQGYGRHLDDGLVATAGTDRPVAARRVTP